ncbi:hypothetical protein [Methanomassiliicoccus luminyensis]|uniref:hypothetical protein n=1 Tax=Methanomassiliicoccus luminyensis TaxID=1080712 RepID=UPI000367F025|nr:hypothetical protein [Methanomassiliicoccus luminyensis]
MNLDLILSILSIVGIGGIVGAFFTYVWEKKKQIQIKENEIKEARYRCTLLLMYAYINPSELSNLKLIRPEIKDLTDLKKELQTEWVGSWIFAGDDTLQAFKEFLEEPNENNFAKTVLSMGKELWNKRSKLPLDYFSIKGFQAK